MSARDVIARAVEEFDGVSIRYDDWAEHIIQRLVAAGYPPIGPDEIHAPSVERCAQIAEQTANSFSNSRDMMVAAQEAAADAKALEIAAALRELMKETSRG